MSRSNVTIPAIIAKLESSTGPDRALDRAIWDAFDLGNFDLARFEDTLLSGSLDAVIRLCERALPDFRGVIDFGARGKNEPYPAQLYDGDGYRTRRSFGVTPALALCLAIVKAAISHKDKANG